MYTLDCHMCMSLNQLPHTYNGARNLLRPLGTRLEPATLTVRIIRGEDLPQMDPGYFQKVKSILHIGTVYKDYVDPYCTVSFAGHEEMTQVIWNKQDPEWNKQINLGMRVCTLLSYAPLYYFF